MKNELFPYVLTRFPPRVPFRTAAEMKRYVAFVLNNPECRRRVESDYEKDRS